jgi:hypothetical protein
MAFKAEWVKLSWRWAKALQRSSSVSTYRLALAILFEAFKQEQRNEEIVLSAAMTGMPRSTKITID